MSLSDALMLVQTLLIVAGFVLAYQQFTRWREEIIHDRRVDMALQLGRVVRRVWVGFNTARYPFAFFRVKEQDPELDPYERHKLDQKHDRDYRINSVEEPLRELRLLMWDCSIIFEPKAREALEENFKELEQLQEELSSALTRSHEPLRGLHDDNFEETDAIIGALDAKGAHIYRKKIDNAIERMKETIRQTTIGHNKSKKYDASEDWRTQI